MDIAYNWNENDDMKTNNLLRSKKHFFNYSYEQFKLESKRQKPT